MKEYNLPRSTPEKQGISSKAISQFLAKMKEQNHELHSLMILRHGHVIAEGWWRPYQREHEHMLFSMTKSFTSIAVGFAISEGLLSLEDTLVSFFPEIKMKQKNMFKDIQVRDLLTLSVGHEKPTMGWDLHQLEGSWIEYFLNIPIDHEPGTRFVYNTSASQMLSAIVHKASGLPLIDYLEPRLFKPLGISRPNWQTSPEGYNTGGHGLSLKTEDVAKFGQFLLQQGCWDGKQLLPLEWIKEATSFQIVNGDNPDDDWQQGYGYQFWMCRNGAYRADGAYGQFCIILPKQDAAIVMTSATHDGASILNLVWEYLLKEMKDDPLSVNNDDQIFLNQQLDKLMLHTPFSLELPLMSKFISYKIEGNLNNVKEVSFKFQQDSCIFILKNSYGEHHIKCGYREWIESKTTLFDNALHFLLQPPHVTVCAKACWKNKNELEMYWCFVNTPFIDKVVCRFDVQQLQLIRTLNTDQGEVRPMLIGKEIQQVAL